MNHSKWPEFIDLIKAEVIPAQGCTEPMAVALAAAKAAETLGGVPQSIDVFLSRNVLKNGMGVGIPGTGLIGLEIAAAVGALGGDSALGLEVLRELKPETVELAKDLVHSNRVKISHKEIGKTLYIEVCLSNHQGSSRVIIQDRHSNIVLIEKNGAIIFDSSKTSQTVKSEKRVETSVREVWDFALTAPIEDLSFILDAAKMNSTISQQGLEEELGMRVGRSISEDILGGIQVADLRTEVVRRTAAGTDARMAGSTLPVMSNSGSGNQGITATMPIVAASDYLKVSEEKLIRSLILSHLMAIHIKSGMDRLSALCGASVAATGASCGIVYLLGGHFSHAEFAIKNMVGNVAGMVCDGAKNACALKVASCVGAAVQGALLAMHEIGVSAYEGIVEGDVERTISNFGRIGSPGMLETDKVILDIMVSKEKES